MRLRAALTAGFAALVLAAPAQAATWTVSNGTSDATTPACNVDLHTCVSLRTALAASEATKDEPDVINVPAGTININNDLVVQSDITINGVSARTNIVDGGFKYRGLRVTASGSAKLNHFTIRNAAGGQGGVSHGGGVLNNSGVAQLSYVRVTTSAPADGGAGGGIANVAGTMTLNHVLVDNNTEGGGILNLGGAEPADRGALLLVDSTVFKNTAGTGGTGGIDSAGNAANLVVLGRTTVADNTGGVRGIGGLNLRSGTGQAVTSIIARNVVAGASANCGDVKPTNSTNNVEDDKECGFDLGGVNPGLASALTNAGGELDVLALVATSAAVDRQAGTCGTNITDQRGITRPQGTGCDAGAYELDQAPTVKLESGPSGTINVRNATFTYSTTEPGVTLQCRLTGPGQPGTFAACSSATSQAYTNLADGSYTFSVRAMDGVFTDPPTVSRSFVVDATLDTQITGGPSGPINDATPTFTFTGSGGAVSFQCRFDSVAFAACTSPFTPATALSQGNHTFEVRAMTAAGGADTTPASRSFTVDTVAPNTTLTPIASPTNDTTPTFTFSSTETGSTFECRVDTAPYASCNTPFTTATLTAGGHTFDVRAIDGVGNVDATPASQTFTVDTAAPPPPVITSPAPNALLMANTVRFDGTAEIGATVTLREGMTVRGSAIASGTGLWTIVMGAVPDGPHTYAVTATDAAGNESGATTRTVTVDTVLPDTTITSGPSGPTNDATPTFTFTSEPGATFECSIDGVAHTACTTPFTTPQLAAGPHTLSVRAVDAAGNRDNTPAVRNFTVDTGVPTATIGNGPAGPTNDATPTFTFTSEPGATFECRIDGAAFAACTSPFTAPSLPDGPHTFDVRATDPTGNTGPVARREFAVDTTPPAAPAVVSGPDGPTTDASPAFGFDAVDAAAVACRLDGPAGAVGEFGACTSPKAFSALAPGDYVFFVRSTDAAGNSQTTQRAFTVTVAQQATPTPTPTATPTPTPPPVANQSVNALPVSGIVLVKVNGKFVPLVPSLIKNGTEVDARKGVVQITTAQGEVARFYDGVFKITQSGGLTTLTLTEKLTGCPKAKKSSASAAAKKPKTRKLWGDGKGRFKTKGQYSAATVRGTKWLVQDTCTTTLTRVVQGVVEVEDFAKKKKVLVKKGKRYTARPKK